MRDAMKDKYVVKLSAHQAKVLNAALALVNQLMNVPPNTAVYPNLGTEGVELPMIKDELKLLHDEIVHQFEEQEKQ
jgi:hypothetical protein